MNTKTKTSTPSVEVKSIWRRSTDGPEAAGVINQRSGVAGKVASTLGGKTESASKAAPSVVVDDHPEHAEMQAVLDLFVNGNDKLSPVLSLDDFEGDLLSMQRYAESIFGYKGGDEQVLSEDTPKDGFQRLENTSYILGEMIAETWIQQLRAGRAAYIAGGASSIDFKTDLASLKTIADLNSTSDDLGRKTWVNMALHLGFLKAAQSFKKRKEIESLGSFTPAAIEKTIMTGSQLSYSFLFTGPNIIEKRPTVATKSIVTKVVPEGDRGINTSPVWVAPGRRVADPGVKVPSDSAVSEMARGTNKIITFGYGPIIDNETVKDRIDAHDEPTFMREMDGRE